MHRYQYFDKVVNVAVMARELAFALDMDARAKTASYCEPGARFFSLYRCTSLTLVLACLALAKACRIAGLEEWHHNAGVDAGDSLVSALAMMYTYAGVRLPNNNLELPDLDAGADAQR
jgi:hypothetical protein